MKYTENLKTIPFELQFRHMPKSRAIHQAVTQQLERFIPLSAPGSRCEVVLDESRPSQKGGIYDISVRLNIPGRRLYAAHCSETGGSHEFLYGAVSAAFEDIKRQMVKDRTRRRRHRHMLAA